MVITARRRRLLEVARNLPHRAAQPDPARRADDDEKTEGQPREGDRLPRLRRRELSRIGHFRRRDAQSLVHQFHVPRACGQISLEVDALGRDGVCGDEADEIVLDPVGDVVIVRGELVEDGPEILTSRRADGRGQVLRGIVVCLPLGDPRIGELRLHHQPAHRVAAGQVIGAQAAYRRAHLERGGLRRFGPGHGLAETRDHREARQDPETEQEREADRNQDGDALSHVRSARAADPSS